MSCLDLPNMEEITFPAVVELNVGGQHFSTLLSTLTREPDSMLAAMFSGRHPVSKDKDGRFFIDADGAIFSQILDYLRFGTLPRITELGDFHKYASYFGIQSLVEQLETYFPIVAEMKATELRNEIPNYTAILDDVIKTISSDSLWGEEKIIHLKITHTNKNGTESSSVDKLVTVFELQAPESDKFGRRSLALLVHDLNKRGYPIKSEHLRSVYFNLILQWPGSGKSL